MSTYGGMNKQRGQTHTMERSACSLAEEVLTHSTEWVDLRALGQGKKSGMQENSSQDLGV